MLVPDTESWALTQSGDSTGEGWSSCLKNQTWFHSLPHGGVCGAIGKWLFLGLGRKWGSFFSSAFPLSFLPAHTSAGRCAGVGLNQTLPRLHRGLGAKWHHSSSQGQILHPTQPVLAVGKPVHFIGAILLLGMFLLFEIKFSTYLHFCIFLRLYNYCWFTGQILLSAEIWHTVNVQRFWMMTLACLSVLGQVEWPVFW